MKQLTKDNPLTETQAAKLPAGTYRITGVTGLYLNKSRPDKGSFCLRYTDPTDGSRHSISIGRYPELTLKAACERGLDYRRRILVEGEPILAQRIVKHAVRKLQTATRHRSQTFQQVADEWLRDSEVKGVWLNNATGARVAFSYLRTYLYPTIGHLPIDCLTPQHLYQCLEPIWRTKHSTATKIRGMLYRIFRWAKAKQLSTLQTNPASMDDDLGILLEQISHALPPPENFASCLVSEVPRLFRELNAMNTTSARLCMFLILTTGRSQAARKATWFEIDFERKTWTIPWGHDKIKDARRDRTIYLSDEAIELLHSLPRVAGCDLLFPNPRGGVLSDAMTSKIMRDLHEKRKKEDGRGWIDPFKAAYAPESAVITIHGTARATFRTWAKDDLSGNNRRFDQEAVELCLLHEKNDPWRGAYDRATLVNERRFIMAEWGKFCFSLLRQDAQVNHHAVLSSAEEKQRAIEERKRARLEAEREAKRQAWHEADAAFVGPRRQRGRPHGISQPTAESDGTVVPLSVSVTEAVGEKAQSGRWSGPGSRLARAKAFAEHQARLERLRRKRERKAAKEVAKEGKHS